MFATAVVILAFQRGMTETALTDISRKYSNGDTRGVWQMMVDTISLNIIATFLLLIPTTIFAMPLLSFVCGNAHVAELIYPVFLMSCWAYLIELPLFLVQMNVDVFWICFLYTLNVIVRAVI